jgi:hypothetical protein
MKKVLFFSLLCVAAPYMQGMQESHDLVLFRVTVGELDDCKVVCEISVPNPKDKELPGETTLPLRYIFEKKGDQNRLAERTIVRCLEASDASAQSLLNDRKNTIASGFKNFTELKNKHLDDSRGFALYKSWVSYCDNNDNTNKVAYIAYCVGSKCAVGYEATASLVHGKSVADALQQLDRNHKACMLIMGEEK